MSILLFILIIAFVAKSQSVVSNRDSIVMSRFAEWMAVHDIRSKDETHLAHIFNNWVDNDKYIEYTNSKNLSYTLGHNAYSGMNLEEFGELMGFKANSDSINKGLRGNAFDGVPVLEQKEILSLEALPTSVDWRAKGKISQIHDQKSCGSCYVFSAVATIETAVAIKTGNLYDLSEQQGVSCSKIKYGNLGCSGGQYQNIFKFSEDNFGLCTEVDYPYTSQNGDTGTCIKTCTPIKETTVSSYVTVTPYSDNAVLTALTIGSINIAIEADTKSFQLYKSGIYDDYNGCNSNSKGGATPDAKPDIDHAVVLVGYGTEAGKDYYILRNSWGLTWGLQDTPDNYGYMKISRGSQYGKYGMCGLLTEPMYPIV